MNLNPDLGAVVGQHIESVPSVAAQGPATTNGGWMTLVPLPFKTSQGQTVYDYELSDATQQGSANLIQTTLRRVKDDPDLAGTNWHQYYGMPAVVQPPGGSTARGLSPEHRVPTPALGSPPPGAGAAADTVMYALDQPPGSVVHGVGFDSLQVTPDPDTPDSRCGSIRERLDPRIGLRALPGVPVHGVSESLPTFAVEGVAE